MPKGKKHKIGRTTEQKSLEDSPHMPSEACKKFLQQFTVDFYRSNTLMALESKFVRYKEQSVQKFNDDMARDMLQALRDGIWYREMEKRDFTKWLEWRVKDSLWNIEGILTKYGKDHNLLQDNTYIEEVMKKADSFVKLMKPYSFGRQRNQNIGWWRHVAGGSEELMKNKLVHALPATANVIEVEHTSLKGAYATVKRVRIEGAPGFELHWEFAAKLSKQWKTRPDLARLEHQNETMAVRIDHPGVVRYVAIHPSKYEGYAYWWNGGTLRQMLNLDNKYGDDIYARTLHTTMSADDVVKASYLRRFRKKRTELAWALVIIMQEVHMTDNLHNDLSPDNILFHFPADETRIYIGVCDWGMLSFSSEPMKSLYGFNSIEEMEKDLADRYWVDPTIAYVRKPDADVEIRPVVTKATEAYGVAKLALRINGGNMSEDYWKLQRPGETSVVYRQQELAEVFESYLNRLCSVDRENSGGLTHLVTRFRITYHWPVPYEHFRHVY
jgi:hypothetical protein